MWPFGSNEKPGLIDTVHKVSKQSYRTMDRANKFMDRMEGDVTRLIETLVFFLQVATVGLILVLIIHLYGHAKQCWKKNYSKK